MAMTTQHTFLMVRFMLRKNSFGALGSNKKFEFVPAYGLHGTSLTQRPSTNRSWTSLTSALSIDSASFISRRVRLAEPHLPIFILLERPPGTHGLPRRYFALPSSLFVYDLPRAAPAGSAA